MEISLSSYVVRGEDGSIDHEATLHKFMQDLIAFESASADEFELIREAVNSVFDRHDNKRMPKPLVVGEAFQLCQGMWMRNAGRSASVHAAHSMQPFCLRNGRVIAGGLSRSQAKSPAKMTSMARFDGRSSAKP